MATKQGLAGVIAGESSISSIIDGVLTYRGINIDDLAEKATFEEVVYLLWHGELPNQGQLDEFKKNLGDHADIPEEVLHKLKATPKGVHPMAVLRTAMSYLALFDDEVQDMSKEANLRKAVKIQAKIPTVVAAYARIRQGKEPVAPNKDMGFAENFLYMLMGEKPEDVAIDAFNTALILHADHEWNASTFSSRVTVATLSDIYSGLTSAIGTLKGPLHGGANEAVMRMLNDIGDLSNVEPYIQKKLDDKEKIMGFGHRVYVDGDPRAKHLQKMSKKLTEMTGEPELYEMSVKIEQIIESQKGLKPNVDFYSASVYHSLGIEHDLFTPIFAISRSSGWTAHMLEQYDNNRLIRPRAEYVGPKNQKFVPMNER